MLYTNTNPNPYAETIREAEDLLTSLQDAAKRLSTAIAAERIIKSRAQDAKETLAAAEAEIVVEAEALAAAGEGPLVTDGKAIAKTSKAYQYALDNMLYQARQGALSHLYRDANRAAIEADNAAIELAQAQTFFTALKYSAELKAAVLRAHQPYLS